MGILFILIFNIFITSVHGFFYTLLPVVILKIDKTYRAYCPWNNVKNHNLVCVVNNDVIGYTVSDSSSFKSSTIFTSYRFINPSLQTWFTSDNCAEVKKAWNTNKTSPNSCKDFSHCHNIAADKSLCTCQMGFFGDPYTGCKQHCLTDDDCTSPVAVCSRPQTNPSALSRCVCKSGYQGDGVMCHHISPCGTNRTQKCGDNRVCVPTGPGTNDFKCMCPYGYFNFNNKCVKEFTATKDTVVTLVGKHVENGSRVEVGDCLSFTLNEGTKSIFFHKNSGDSVYVKKQINNSGQFSLFYILTDEVTVYSKVQGSGFGLTKLYSMSNTLLDCKFGKVKVFDPSGHEVSDDEVFKKLQTKPTVTKTQTSKDESPETEVKTTQQTHQTKVQPVVEVHVRELTEGEKLGGLTGLRLPSAMLNLVTDQSNQAVGSQSQKAQDSVSHLQTGVSTSSDKSEL